MNVETYLSEMRAAGYRFYVTMHPLKKEQGILTMFPEKPNGAFERDKFYELETWRREHLTNQQLAKAITASQFTKPKKEGHQHNDKF